MVNPGLPTESEIDTDPVGPSDMTVGMCFGAGPHDPDPDTEAMRDEHGRRYYFKAALNQSDAPEDLQDAFQEASKGEANLIGSFCGGEHPHAAGALHKPCIDIDHPARLLPSSTEGHFHLYFDKAVTWENYVKLLQTLVDCGLLSQFNFDRSIRRGMTHVRCPWIKKTKGTQP